MDSQTIAPRSDGFKPKYTQFHPLTRVWLQNPFTHDVVFQVADEYNRPFKYRLPAGKMSELPGGAIATLGVKAVVDELIQSNKEDQMRMWDENVRKKHEKNIILRVKNTSPVANSSTPGEVNLAVPSTEAPEESEAQAPQEEQSTFADLNAPQPAPAPELDQLPPAAAQGISDITAASLPSNDTVVEQ